MTDISKKLDVSRDTAYKYLKADDFSPTVPTPPKSKSMMDEYRPFIESYLDEDGRNWHKQRQGKLLCEFVAMIVRNRMHVMLADHLEATGRRRNFMTVPAAVSELEKIELVRQYDGRYRLDHAVTATQKEILAAFGMDEAYIRMVAAKLGKRLDAIRKGEM